MDNLLPDRVVIALYFAGVTGAGYWGLRRARSPEGYLVAGRRLTAAAGALASMVAGSVVVVSLLRPRTSRERMRVWLNRLGGSGAPQ